MIVAVCAIDSVVRTVYYKYFHPKEVLVTNGVLNRWRLVLTCKVAWFAHLLYCVEEKSIKQQVK